MRKAQVWSPSKLAQARAAKRQSTVRPTINTAALTGVLFAILFLFAGGTTGYGGHHGIYAEPPPAQHTVSLPGADREDALLVTIMRDSATCFRTEKVEPEQIEARIRSGVRHGAERRVYLRVDRRARYASVKAVLDQIQRAGIQNVAFLTP